MIAITSTYGLVGQYERVAYCAAKAGVIGMVRAMAVDFADKGVRVNAIAPDFIETELSHAITRQASDAASFMAGQCLTLDGGIRCGEEAACPAKCMETQKP